MYERCCATATDRNMCAIETAGSALRRCNERSSATPPETDPIAQRTHEDVPPARRIQKSRTRSAQRKAQAAPKTAPRKRPHSDTFRSLAQHEDRTAHVSETPLR